MWEIAIIPGKLSRFDQRSGYRGTMPTNELGCRVHYDIRSMLKWSAQVGSREGIIDHQGHSSFVCYVSNGTDIQHITTRITNCLTIQCACA